MRQSPTRVKLEQAGRHSSSLHPELLKRSQDYVTNQDAQAFSVTSVVDRWLLELGCLIDLSSRRRVLEVGCGPHPHVARHLFNQGFVVRAIEPMPDFAESAQRFLGDTVPVGQAAAESIPLEDGSVDVVLCASVLEHVDSPHNSLNEMFRVLAPGGALYIVTTSRHNLRKQGEFNVRMYNWLPRMLKESYVHHHLHVNPRLANYSHRPAVHWFTFGDLCELGRDAGFGHFHSPLDLRPDDPNFRPHARIKRLCLRLYRKSPLFRSAVLMQRSLLTRQGTHIIMVKRS